MKADGGGPAFPVSTRITGQDDGEGGEYGHQTSPGTWQFPGMSLRDWFAGQALVGFLAHPDAMTAYERGTKPSEFADSVARSCFTMADAMLRARSAAEEETT